MAKREGQAQEAYEAGTRSLFPGEAWVRALARGLQRELAGADMGTPVGQKVQEELGSLGYEQALREAYPEDFAYGREAHPVSALLDPLSLMGMGGMLFRRGVTAPDIRPMLPNGQVFEGEVLPPRTMIEAGPHLGGNPPRAFAGPTNQFERNAVSAAQRGRRGFGYGYEPPSYWEEGGQGFRPSIDDFVPLDVVRNDAQYFDRVAQEQASALDRQGRNAEAIHPLYGPNANRPNYGAEPGGDYVSPIARKPAPGVRQMPGGPAPFGQGGEGKGYFGNLPNPGVRSDIRQEIGQGAGMPRLRYEPVQGGLPTMAQGGMPAARGGLSAVRGSVEAAGNLPTMARGRGMVPTEIQGEFVEVPGIGYVPREEAAARYGMGTELPPDAFDAYFRAKAAGRPRFTVGGEEAPWDGSIDFGVTGGGGSRIGAPSNQFAGGAARAGLGSAVLGLAGDSYFPHSNPLTGSVDSYFGYPHPSDMRIGPSSGIYGRFGELEPMSRPFESPQINIPARRIQESKKNEPKKVSTSMKKTTDQKSEAKKPADQAQGFEPNFNYLFTQALDRLTGQNEAERGRQYQQDVEAYEKKYGPIYY